MGPEQVAPWWQQGGAGDKTVEVVDHNGTTLRIDTGSPYGGCCIAISLAGKKARFFFPTPAQRKALRKALAQAKEDR